MKRVGMIAALALHGMGCHPTQSRSGVSIYGGTPVPDGRWTGTVALLSYNSVDCSGVLVHPRLVLTAAHCVEDREPSLAIYQGNGSDEEPLEGYDGIERVALAPAHDLAYVLLKDERPIEGRDLIPVLHRAEEKAEVLKLQQRVTLVGFGEREGGAFGRKFETDVSITGLREAEVLMGGLGHDACSGDSGGPAYVRLLNGEDRVLGLASRGRACGRGGVWSLIDADLCWIVKDSGLDLNLPPGTC